MEDRNVFEDGIFENSDVEEEFRSCCAEDEEWQDTEEYLAESSKGELDEWSIRMFFKGVSMPDTGISGIGVVIERLPGLPMIQVQKKLEFHVEALVAEHLALLDGMLEALKHGIRRVFAFTDSEEVYCQIADGELLNDQLLVALGLRILEHAENLELFELKLVPSSDIARPLRLALEAIGTFSPSSNEDGALVDCMICCEEKQQSQMVKLNCSHIFCVECMIKHVKGRLQTSQIPIICPHLKCKYYISTSECRSFLPDTCYESLEQAIMEADVLNLDNIYCPFPDCLVLLNPSQRLSSSASSSSHPDINCIECPECQRFICINCGVPWHSSMSCEEFLNLPAEERNSDIMVHHLAQNNNWRRCRQCRRMIERTHGCYHMTCWCGHEFCYSCGAEFREGIKICHCAYWDEENDDLSVEPSEQESELRWESFDPLTVLDAYSEQEKAQLALVQRFLAGGFGLSDHQPCQSPPRCSDSYMDALRELHQLPWLENFVSVISDNYHEAFIQ